MNQIRSIFFVMIATIILISCKKNSIKDTGVISPTVNVTTYDYLKANPKFKYLISLIDKGNLKSQLNSAKTFFAPTDVSFLNYVDWQLSPNGGNQLFYDLEALSNSPSEIDSLRMYMFNTKIARDNHDKSTAINIADGKPQYHTPEIIPASNVRFKTWLRRAEYDFTTVYFMNFGKVNGDDDIVLFQNTGNQDLFEDADRTSELQTSGIITTTGVLHVLDNNHTFLFK
jgi:hypothetical protein